MGLCLSFTALACIARGLDTRSLDSVEVASFCLFFVVNVDIIDVNNAVVDVIFEGFEAEDFIVQPKVIDCISASNA